MAWFMVLVIIFNGHQHEFIGAKEYESREACNTQAMALAQIPIRAPMAVTCIQEHRA